MSEDVQKSTGKTFSRDSVANTLLVSITLSLVCSVLVATTAVLLRPVQERNVEEFRQRIILDVAGLLQPGADIEQLFSGIESRMVELDSGSYVDEPDPAEFDAVAAASDPDLSVAIPPEADLASIHRRANYAPVYLVMRGDEIEQVILPVYGPGLYSTLLGYLALADDGNTIRGLRFYSHAETPGLGAQIDNPDWRQQWVGKQVFDEAGVPQIEVIRGPVRIGSSPEQARQASFQIDGLSGATLTGRGVTNLVRYWTGPHGFGPYLNKLQRSDGSTQ